MDLSSRIEKIRPFFVSFNVIAEESASYAIIRLPEGWTIPDKAALKENFKVEVAPLEGAYCFMTEISNSSEQIFDAIDYVVDFNQKFMERKELLLAKVKELKELFAQEPLENLKRLKFAFDPVKKQAKKSAKSEVPEKKTTEAEKPAEEPEPIKEEEPSNSLMSFAKDITGEK